jgi:hypothetical protein
MSDAGFIRDASLTQQIVTPMVRHLAAAKRNGARRGVEMRPNLTGLHGLLGYAVVTHENRGPQIDGRLIQVCERRAPRALKIVL